MSNSVTVRVPARLHLGFLDPSGGKGRRFGSIGLPLSEPETVVSLSRSARLSSMVPTARARRATFPRCADASAFGPSTGW